MLILDNSVVVKWFFKDEVSHIKAISIRDLALKNPADFSVPALIYSELINVLSKKSKNDLLFVNHCLDNFAQMQLRTLNLSKDVLMHAVDFSCHGFSGYDATYLALAKDLHAKWLTADLKAVTQDQRQHSIWLDEWV